MMEIKIICPVGLSYFYNSIAFDQTQEVFVKVMIFCAFKDSYGMILNSWPICMMSSTVFTRCEGLRR